MASSLLAWPEDLKPMAFLVLPPNDVLHAFFFLLFEAIGYNIIYTMFYNHIYEGGVGLMKTVQLFYFHFIPNVFKPLSS